MNITGIGELNIRHEIGGDVIAELLGDTPEEFRKSLILADSIRQQGLLPTGGIAPLWVVGIDSFSDGERDQLGFPGLAEYFAARPGHLELWNNRFGDIKIPDVSGAKLVAVSGNRRLLLALLLGMSERDILAAYTTPKDGTKKASDWRRLVLAGNPAKEAKLPGRKAVSESVWYASAYAPDLRLCDLGFPDSRNPYRLGCGIGGQAQRPHKVFCVAAIAARAEKSDELRAVYAAHNDAVKARQTAAADMVAAALEREQSMARAVDASLADCDNVARELLRDYKGAWAAFQKIKLPELQSGVEKTPANYAAAAGADCLSACYAIFHPVASVSDTDEPGEPEADTPAKAGGITILQALWTVCPAQYKPLILVEFPGFIEPDAIPADAACSKWLHDIKG